MGIAWKDGYSADIEIYLQVGDTKYNVAQVGGYSLILRDACSFPPNTEAKLVTSIDGRTNVRNVVLHKGVSLDCAEVDFQ